MKPIGVTADREWDDQRLSAGTLVSWRSSELLPGHALLHRVDRRRDQLARRRSRPQFPDKADDIVARRLVHERNNIQRPAFGQHVFDEAAHAALSRITARQREVRRQRAAGSPGAPASSAMVCACSWPWRRTSGWPRARWSKNEGRPCGRPLRDYPCEWTGSTYRLLYFTSSTTGRVPHCHVSKTVLTSALLAQATRPSFYREWLDSVFARDIQRLFGFRGVSRFNAF